MREWKGSNNAAFTGQQRQAIEGISTQLHELSRSAGLLSGNRVPSRGGSTFVVSSSRMPDGDYGDVRVSSSGTRLAVETTGGTIHLQNTASASDINTALSSFLTGGGQVHLAPGTYTLTEKIVMSGGNQTLCGSGQGSTILIGGVDANTDIIQITQSGSRVLDLSIYGYGTTALTAANGAGAEGIGRGIAIEVPQSGGGDFYTDVRIERVTVLCTSSWCIYDSGLVRYGDLSAIASGVTNTAGTRFPLYGFNTGSTATASAVYTKTCTTTSGSKTITSAAAFGAAVAGTIIPGMCVHGTGIAPGTWVVEKTNPSTIVLSKPCTASGSVTLTFDHLTNLCLAVSLRVIDCTLAFPNSGGALYQGYGSSAAITSGLLTNSYSFGSFTSFFVDGATTTDAVSLGAVHYFGALQAVLDNKPVFQSPSAQTGTPAVPHDDVDATMLSFHNCNVCTAYAPYFEVGSTYCLDGEDMLASGEDGFGYREHWFVTLGGTTDIVFREPYFISVKRKKDPASILPAFAGQTPPYTGDYADGFPLRLFRGLAGSSTGLIVDGGHSLYYRDYYSTDGIRTAPVAPWESGDQKPVPENGSVDSAPWDKDDLYFPAFLTGDLTHPFLVKNHQIAHFDNGVVRDISVYPGFGVENQQVARVEDFNLGRFPMGNDVDQSGMANNKGDISTRTSYSKTFRPGMYAYTFGGGRQRITVNTHSNTTLDSASAVFANVEVGMLIQSDGATIPAGTYVTAKASSSSITISAAATATGTETLTFFSNGIYQREGLWIVSGRDTNWRQVPFIRVGPGIWGSIYAGDLWMQTSGTPVASVYPAAQFKWYDGSAWQAPLNRSVGTAAGDLIKYTASDTPARLAIGSTNQVLTVSGGAPVWADPAKNNGSVSLSAQTASIGSTTLFTGSASTAGLYRVSLYSKTTTAGSAGDKFFTTISYNDGTAQTIIPWLIDGSMSTQDHQLDTLNFRSQSSVVIKLAASQNITFTTTVTKAGSPVYSIDLRVEALG